jgi:cobalamin synthase
MPMNINLTEILFPLVISVMFLVICYARAYAIRRGKPLTSFMKNSIWYATIFCLGMAYAMALQERLEAVFGSPHAWIFATVAWVLILGGAAWLQHRKTFFAKS